MKKVPLGVLLVAGLSVSVLSKAKEPQPTYLVDIPNPAVCYDNDGTNSVGTKKLIPPAVSGDNKATIVICKPRRLLNFWLINNRCAINKTLRNKTLSLCSNGFQTSGAPF